MTMIIVINTCRGGEEVRVHVANPSPEGPRAGQLGVDKARTHGKKRRAGVFSKHKARDAASRPARFWLPDRSLEGRGADSVTTLGRAAEAGPRRDPVPHGICCDLMR